MEYGGGGERRQTTSESDMGWSSFFMMLKNLENLEDC